MYKLTITTTYNNIILTTDDYKKPEIQEILMQPYVIAVDIEEIKDTKVRRKIKCPQCPFESRDLPLKCQKIQCFFCPESGLASSWVDDKNPSCMGKEQ